MPNSLNRRHFLKSGGTAALVGSAITHLAAAPASSANANERIRIGFIGPGGRGFGAHVKNLAKLRNDGANIELVAVAEVYSVQRDKVADYIHQENGNTPATYLDYRDMLEQEELDAVSIATPDHWHPTG